MFTTQKVKRAGIGAAALALSLSLAACGGSESPSAPEPGNSSSAAPKGELNQWGGQMQVATDAAAGGTFTFGVQFPIEDLDPANAIGGSMQGAVRQIYGTLFEVDGSGQAAPSLAESLTSEDNINWTLKIRSGMTFHDGTPFDAAAVAFHIERVAAKGSRSMQSTQARMIKKADVVDPTTLQITLNQPFGNLPVAFAEGSLAHVPSPTAAKKAGAKFSLEPVGAGPFKVDSFTPAVEISMSKFTDYKGPEAPKVDKLVYKIAPESKARVSAVSTGDLDATSVRSAADVDAARSAGLTALEQPSSSNFSMVLNLKDPMLSDIRVRQALNMAIDRAAVNQVVFGGKNKVMKGMLNDSNPYFIDANWPEFDQEKAKALIAEVEAEKGPIKLDMMHPGGPDLDRISALSQQMLGDVGIDLTYSSGTPAALVGATMSGDFQLQLRDSGVPPETFLRLESYYTAGSPFNSAGVTNDTLTELFKKSHVAADAAEMKTIAGDMQTELAAWLPQVPIVSTSGAFVLGAKVAGFPGGILNTSSELFDATGASLKK